MHILPAMLTAGDGPETLLPSCVPYLKLHPLVVQQNLLDLEIYPVYVQETGLGET